MGFLREWFASLEEQPPVSTVQHAFRVLLGAAVVFAGLGHLTWARTEFQAQVPSWMPLDADLVVVLSGVVELVLGAALVVLVRRRVVLGWLAAGLFVAVFPGNVAQWLEGNDGFGLDTDTERAIRLLFQPLLVAWALWSTGAWRSRRARAGRTVAPLQSGWPKGE